MLAMRTATSPQRTVRLSKVAYRAYVMLLILHESLLARAYEYIA